jgi:hypothetical protein
MFYWIDPNIGVMGIVTKKDWAKVVKTFRHNVLQLLQVW